MSSDLRRRNDESKRSVFDRLGPDTKSTSSNNNNSVNSKISLKMPSVCPSYSKTGYCQLGSKCKYEHARRDKDKDDTKSRIVKRTNIEKVNDHTKEAETKLKSAIVSKSTDDCDKKYRKVAETSTKTLKPSDKLSPTSDSRKRKLEDHDQTKQKGRKLGNESSKDEQLERIVKPDEKSSDKSSSKQKKGEPGIKNSSSTGSKKASHNILSPLSSSSKDGKSSEVERLPNKEVHSKGHSRHHDHDDDAQRMASKSKSDPRKDEKREPRKVVDSKKDVDVVQPSNSGQKVARNLSPAMKTKEVSKAKGKRRSASESSSSSSSSGSSSSSSGSSSGSSSRSSYTSREKSPNERRKRREVDKKSRKSKQDSEKSQKDVVKKSDDGDKRSSAGKHVKEYSEDGVDERSGAKRSKQKVESSQGSKRDYSKSTSPRFNSPAVKSRDDHYYSSRKHPEDRHAKVKVHNPDYERGSPDRSREGGRRSKTDKAYLNKISPEVELRRKEDYYRGEDFDRYNRRGDGDYESMERRKSRERLMYDMPAKDAIYDEPIRRDRLSRRGEWEQIESDNMLSKHKRHLSNESYSPARKKKRSSPRDDYRDRGEKIYESEGRKRDYGREDDNLMEDFERRRRSSHDSWHQHDKEKTRQRRDKSDQERSRERGRNDYYTRSPLESSDYSPRHRPELGKRGGDYSGYDYDVERSGRSRSRSSLGSKPAGRSRYYEGKRSLGGSSGIPSLFPPSYEYRDTYRATPEAEVMEGRGFAAKPLYWDEYKRPEGPPSGSSYRGVSNRSRPAHQPPSTSGPSVDWEAARMPGKPHEWDNRYERSSEEFLSRRDILLPPPPRSRQENSEVPSPAPPTNSAPAIPIEAPIAPSIQPLKAMTFELEGYEEVTEEELEDCLAEEDVNNDASEKDGSQLAYEDEVESLPKKIPLVEMTDIEWESLVKADDSKPAMDLPRDEEKFLDIVKDVGVSKQFAGEELFEKISLCLVEDDEDGDDENNDGDDDCCDEDGGGGGDDDGKKKSKAILVVNGDAGEEKMATSEVKENGEADPTPETWPDEATLRADPEVKGHDSQVDGKENEVETFDHGLKTSPSQKNGGVLLHDVANFQVTSFLKKRRRASAMRDIGPYRRALCARRDLAIRRTMCRIEKDEIVMFPAQLADQELYRLSLQLFQQNGKVAQENVLITLA